MWRTAAVATGQSPVDSAIFGRRVGSSRHAKSRARLPGLQAAYLRVSTMTRGSSAITTVARRRRGGGVAALAWLFGGNVRVWSLLVSTMIRPLLAIASSMLGRGWARGSTGAAEFRGGGKSISAAVSMPVATSLPTGNSTSGWTSIAIGGGAIAASSSSNGATTVTGAATSAGASTRAAGTAPAISAAAATASVGMAPPTAAAFSTAATG